MRRGILFDNRRRRHNYVVAVAMALGEYRQVHGPEAPAPSEVYFNPAERPADNSVRGLTVHVDRAIRPGYLRVTTDELDEAKAARVAR